MQQRVAMLVPCLQGLALLLLDGVGVAGGDGLPQVHGARGGYVPEQKHNLLCSISQRAAQRALLAPRRAAR